MSDTADAERFIVPGELLNERYLVGEQVGRGAYGVVCRAVDQQTGDVVAVKALPPVTGPQSATAMGRFRREMKVIYNLNHPSIIALYDWGETRAGGIFMVMEYVDGETLGDVVSRGAMKPHVALEATRQLAGALDAAHQLGIIHRDLKPDNIMLVPDDETTYQVKVLDFGMAKMLAPLDEESLAELTREGMAVGTPRYIAPEQARARGIGPPSDLYAVGLLMYEMFSGTPVITATEVREAVALHVSPEPLELEEIEQVPREVRPILRKLLEKDHRLRFQSGAELVEALAAQGWRSGPVVPADLTDFEPGPDLGAGPSRRGEGPAIQVATPVPAHQRPRPVRSSSEEPLELDEQGWAGAQEPGGQTTTAPAARPIPESQSVSRGRRWFRAPRTVGEWVEGTFSVGLISFAFLVVGAQAAGTPYWLRLGVALSPVIVALVWAGLRDSEDWAHSFGRRGWICAAPAVIGAHLLGPADLAMELARHPGWFLAPVQGVPGSSAVEAVASWVALNWAGVLFTLTGTGF